MFLNRVILSTLKAFNSKTGSHREEHLVTLMLCRSFGTYFPKHLLKEPFLYCMLSHKAGEGPTDTTVPFLLKLPFTTFLFSSPFFFYIKWSYPSILDPLLILSIFIHLIMLNRFLSLTAAYKNVDDYQICAFNSLYFKVHLKKKSILV